MTREEAIKNLQLVKDALFDQSDVVKALEMAIKALEQESCEDAISRRAVLDAITANCIWENEYNLTSSRIKKAVENLPPVNAQPKTGHWIHRENMDYLDKNKVVHNHFMCQDCGFIHDFIDGHTAQYNYCPNCGAKMEVEE